MVPTTVSFVFPLLSFQRSLTARLPHVPLVRFAKKRNVGRVTSTHTAGETAVPVAAIARDLESPAPCTLYDSLPATTDAPLSDHPPLPASKAPLGARL